MKSRIGAAIGRMTGRGVAAAAIALVASAWAGSGQPGFIGTVLAEEQRACRVSHQEGNTVRYWRGSDWVALSLSELPADTSRIETGARTRIVLTCSDGIAVTIGYGTDVDLATLTGTAPDKGIVLDLIRGIVGIVAPGGSWSTFQVRTPLAIASVRSTAWLVETAREAGTAVFLRAGAVAVRPRADDETTSVVLHRGEGVTITPDGSFAPVRAWQPPRIARSTAQLGFEWH